MDAVGGVPHCLECGAPQPEGAACRDCFEALLAFENERPTAFGAVHHLTVATYFLQHPAGYTAEVLRAWRSTLADALDGRVSPGELRRRHTRQFDGAKRVRAQGARPPAGWPTRWPLHVVDTLDPRLPLPTIEDYVAGARAWASATRATLDAAMASTDER